MRPVRDRRPAVEPLDARNLPSAGLHAAAATLPVITSTMNSSHAVLLAGSTSGTYSTPIVNPDVGGKTVLSGNGAIGLMGNVSVSGEVHATGFVATGHAHGTVTLSNALGSLTVRLWGPSEKGFGPLPNTFLYKIVGGTGQYADLTGVGHTDLRLTPGHGPNVPPGGFTPHYIVANTFTLRFYQ
jgi:hypothetical protein